MIQSVLNAHSVLVQSVNIGVTGHRTIPSSSSARVQKNIDLVLTCIKNAVQQVRSDNCYKDFFDSFDHGQDAKLRVISQLAEGIDRTVAHAALNHGFQLQSLLPFRQDVYEKTFDENEQAMQDFHYLLEQSDNIFEIACSNDNSSQAYADASRLMLTHSDLLLAVWNGKKTKYIAGTYATMQAAKRSNFPIICIPCQEDASGGDVPDGAISAGCIAFISEVEVKLFCLDGAESDTAIAAFTACIRNYMEKIMLPHRVMQGIPGYTAQDAARRLRKTAGIYNAITYARMPFLKFDAIFEWFIRRFAKTSPTISVGVTDIQDSEAERIKQFKKNASGYWFKLKEHFSKMAAPYAAIYRNRLFFRNFIPVLALVALVLAINADWWFGFSSENALENIYKWVLYAIQMVLWAWVFFLITQESRKMVKSRFYAYRAMAEHCRLSPFLWAVGYCNVRYKHSYSLSHNGHGESAWYYRLLARNAGFASSDAKAQRIVLDSDAIVAWLLWLKNAFFVNQYKYHAKRASKLSILCTRLNLLAYTLYILGMGFVVVRGIAHWLRDTNAADFGDFNVVVIAIAFTVPTVAAFFSAYAGNSGFETHLAVSHDMCETFEALCKEADDLCEEIHSAQNELSTPDSPQKREARMKRLVMEGNVAYSHILDFCEKTSTHCLNELTDWVNSSDGNLNKLL